MSSSLELAEKNCDEILKIFASISTQNLPLNEREEMKKRVIRIQTLLAEAKKKVLMKTQKGKQLAQQSYIDIENFQRSIQKISRESDNNRVVKVLDTVSKQLTKVEDDIDKIVTFWKSYEMVIT